MKKKKKIKKKKSCHRYLSGELIKFLAKKDFIKYNIVLQYFKC